MDVLPRAFSESRLFAFSAVWTERADRLERWSAIAFADFPGDAPATLRKPLMSIDLPLSETVKRIKPSATIAAATKAKELRAAGHDVLSFTLGEPDFTTPEHICRAAKAAIESGQTHYTPAGGTPALRAAIAARYANDHGVEVTAAEVVVSNGAKHSVHNTLTALCGPGDEVLIPTPYWVSYSDLVEITGATPVMIETTQASGFTLQPSQLEAAITDNTRLLMLNSPCNPTGSVYPRDLLHELASLCVERDLFILSDEIYAKLVYDDTEFTSVGSLGADVRERTVVVDGVSKAYAMTGWRIGWTISDPRLAKAMEKLQSQETSCPSSISQAAAIEAVSGPQDCVGEMRTAFAERRRFVLDRLQAIDGLDMATPTGAFYAFFNVASYFGKPLGGGITVENATDFCTALLEAEQVALVTGDAFGAPGYVRMSYATDRDTLSEGLDRLTRFLGQ